MTLTVRRILFPTDFSLAARQAQDYACALADKFAAELHVIHIVADPTPVAGSKGAWALPDDIRERALQAAEAELTEQLKTGFETVGAVVQAVLMGEPVREIVRYAREHQIDVIVIGTHGRRGVSHLLLGSVAEKLVRLSTCPVLTVHPECADSATNFVGRG
jgi:universal stress protein A